MMLVIVTERTKEIGTMKALGFKDRDILAQIVSEGLLIGIFGGAAGILTGIAASYILPSLVGVTMSSSNPATPLRVGRSNLLSSALHLSYEPYINPIIVLVSLVLSSTSEHDLKYLPSLENG
ncbi:MAG: FtsX-like permease family protein [Ignisphaera sp.]|nr:FtsX-like permease family protein [Ignisphaera sp.]MCX8167858.1 FtsX-like permease family protein [Ignisphaera sp.]MDW8086273.1 FtsX-like permease family protein [Ignisphaera sp.]